jgi:hypothetical protein
MGPLGVVALKLVIKDGLHLLDGLKPGAPSLDPEMLVEQRALGASHLEHSDCGQTVRGPSIHGGGLIERSITQLAYPGSSQVQFVEVPECIYLGQAQAAWHLSGTRSGQMATKQAPNLR